MPPKKSPAVTVKQKTSLSIDPAVYRRAWDYKLDSKKEMGDIVTEALDEYLKKRGA